ncbi:hypothetical protein Tco_0228067 [Tanacetum coccineum]
MNALSPDDLANVYNVQALYLAMTGNKLTNEYRIISRDLSKLKNDFVLLKSKNGSLEHEISKLENNLLKARNGQDLEGSQLVNDLRSEGVRLSEELSVLQDMARSLEDSRKVLAEEVEKLCPIDEEVELLCKKLNLADLEQAELIRNALPLAVKKLTTSDQFNQAMGDLQQKAMILGRVQDLDEVHGLGASWELKYIADYDPEEKKSLMMREMYWGISLVEPPACPGSTSAPL